MIKGIKICGISDLETLSYILNHPHPPKFIGFITNYKKSRRYIEYDKLKKLVSVKKYSLVKVPTIQIKKNTISKK